MTELQVGVKALLRNGEGKFLLMRRNPEKYPEVGAAWDIVGGRIDPGSPLMENLKREIKEETGLDLEEEPRLVAAQDILRVTNRHVIRLTYVGTIEGTPTIDGDHTEWKFFSSAEIKKLEKLDIYVKELIQRGTIL